MKRKILVFIIILLVFFEIWIFIKPYLKSYNIGNALYKRGMYDDAIEQYNKALLSFYIPKSDECKIRINYALAVCKTVIVDETNEESIKYAIRLYESAIDMLTEKGCANRDDDNGHSKEAQILKNDIQKEIDRLKELLNQDTKSEEDKEESDKEEKKEEESIEEKIQNIKEDATANQRDQEELFRIIDDGYLEGRDKKKIW